MKVLILGNSASGVYSFRKELITNLVDKGYKVKVSVPRDSEYEKKIKKLGAEVIIIDFNRLGTNPLVEIRLFVDYYKLISKIKPDIVLTYTVKPNLYGGIVSRIKSIDCVPNITGTGKAGEFKGIKKKVLVSIYKVALNKSKRIFFQNKANRDDFINNKIIGGSSKYTIIPGSGVNISEYRYNEYPTNKNEINIIFVGRIVKEKGISELLEAAKVLHKKSSRIKISIAGAIQDDVYADLIEKYHKSGYIHYLGRKRNIIDYYKKCHALVNPTYREGMSNVILEASSTGRPVIASNIDGCKEAFIDNVTGLGFIPGNVDELIQALERFERLSLDEMRMMGIKGSKYVAKKFNRQIVIDKYLEVIKE